MIKIAHIDHARGYGLDHLRDPSGLRYLIGREYWSAEEAARTAAARDLPQDSRCAPAPYRIEDEDGTVWIVWGDGTLVDEIRPKQGPYRYR